jgi:hypothetical protein
MDAGVVAAIFVVVLLLVAVVSTSSYIGQRLQVDPIVVVVVGILFWPAWLVMLLVAAGRTDHVAGTTTNVAYRAIPTGTVQYPSLSDTALATRSVAASDGGSSGVSN